MGIGLIYVSATVGGAWGIGGLLVGAADAILAAVFMLGRFPHA